MEEHKKRDSITKILSKEFEKWAFGLDYLKSLIYILIAIVIFISIVDRINFYGNGKEELLTSGIHYYIYEIRKLPFEKDEKNLSYPYATYYSNYSYILKKKYIIGRNREFIFPNRKINVYEILIASNIRSVDIEYTGAIYVKTQEEKEYLLKNMLEYDNEIEEIKLIDEEENPKIKHFIQFLNGELQ